MDYRDYVARYNDSIEINCALKRRVGGKAMGLFSLKPVGVCIPPWLVITCGFFESIVEETPILREILFQDDSDDVEKGESIRKVIKDLTFKEPFITILHRVWEKTTRAGKKRIAVRSSAVGEDEIKHSFAGMMDSFLNIRTEAQFLEGVKNTWASLYTERVITYRKINNLNPWHARMAVIVQEMVEPESASVLFTAHPVSANTGKMVIQSVWGLGNGLVSGERNADTFILNARGKHIKTEIVDKVDKVSCQEEGGIIIKKTGKNMRNKPSLTNNKVLRLGRIALVLKKQFQTDVDIEFAVLRNSLYILQCRPITANGKKADVQKEGHLIWDNSNIIESYSGITTPLTFSFIRMAYANVYRQLCEVLGVDQRVIEKNENLFQNMLGFIKGRVYYNLVNWYKLISFFPGFKYNKEFMEQMMGLRNKEEYQMEDEPVNFFEKYFFHLPKLIVIGIKMTYYLLTMEKRMRYFFKHFYLWYSYYTKIDYGSLSASQLLQIRYDLDKRILKNWKAPILNDLKAMIFYGILKKLTQQWDIDPEGGLQNDLLSSQGNMKSTDILKGLFSLVEIIKKDQTVKDLFLKESPGQVLSELQNNSLYSDINRNFIDYLNEYGIRCFDEMKLESVPLKDNPIFCISLIQNNLKTEGIFTSAKQKRSFDAQRELKKKIKGFKYFLYKWILRHTKQAIRDRENQRFCRAEIYHIVRTIARAAGKRWTQIEILNRPDDIFFLDLYEIESFVKGTSVYPHLKQLIELRRHEYMENKKTNLPDHFETWEEVYTADFSLQEKGDNKQAKLLKGTGCYRGVVEGEVVVLTAPDSGVKLNGEILVAKQTDPGWVLLFPKISGLIVERGSMLSHSAIVAREMGIPTVVGVTNASTILKTGNRVRLDGLTGSIRVIEVVSG